MKRRDLFRAGAVVAIAGATGLPVIAAGGRRVSVVKGDPGERLYGEACGDGKSVRVFLDGVEQRDRVEARRMAAAGAPGAKGQSADQ